MFVQNKLLKALYDYSPSQPTSWPRVWCTLSHVPNVAFLSEELKLQPPVSGDVLLYAIIVRYGLVLTLYISNARVYATCNYDRVLRSHSSILYPQQCFKGVIK